MKYLPFIVTPSMFPPSVTLASIFPLSSDIVSKPDIEPSETLPSVELIWTVPTVGIGFESERMAHQ